MTTPPAAPDNLQVGAHTYRVLVDHDGLVGVHADNRGSTHNETLTIALDGSLAATLQRETLLHETIHAAWDQTALTALEVQEQQEVVVTAFAPVLVAILRDNPKLVAYLTSP
ncbi:hypothetical protein [Iamia sp.]|uniref:hypothetical protein n=1 Tax=Iamia sp. TaxID=2722710 RepID=UPI002C4915F1|nr:hypothetical protein [Iamia sp.]HXH58456.1 hypothetical protein [Iamia sp.]